MVSDIIPSGESPGIANDGFGHPEARDLVVEVEVEENQIPGEVELEKVSTSEMDISLLEREASSDNWRINWDACKPAFIYSDLDTLENELGEIYGYYELTSLSYNFEMFHTYLETKKIEQWFTSTPLEKNRFLDDVLDDLELVDEYKRSDAVLAISYLMQGCWKDLETASEQLSCIEENVMLLLQCNGFWRIWNSCSGTVLQIQEDSRPWSWGINERIMENCLSILCTITNVSLRKRDHPTVQEFLSEIKTAEGDSVLIWVLDSFARAVIQLTSRNFLLKKLLLFARNLILLSAGDSDDLRRIKDECRQTAGLKPCGEDTILNCQKIPILQKNSGWNNLDVNLMTLDELDEHARLSGEAETESENSCKSLPWPSKASMSVLGACLKDCNTHKGQRRPIPVWLEQKANRLVKHLHVPLSTFQLQEEQLIREYPNTFGGKEKPFVERTEELFVSLLPALESSINAMMMVLADATPPTNPAQVNPKISKINAPFIPKYGGDAIYSVEDSIRQAEIIAKAISAILILLLKHMKLNHIYQFECIASEIVAACFIPTVLRFFNRDVTRNVCQRPTLQHPHCPFKAISVDLCLDQRGIENTSNSTLFGLSWRNTFSYINWLRILNKVVKGKPSRILMLRMFKSHIFLKHCLHVKDPLFQQYILKLLKLQLKFLDQEWKRNNQRIISAIYHKVRHRLLEDWIGEISSSTKMRKRPEQPKLKKWPWDYNVAEVCLHRDILSFLSRKYGVQVPSTDEEDEICSEFNESEIIEEIGVYESFKETYEDWLKQEVLNKNIDWDNLLRSPHLV